MGRKATGQLLRKRGGVLERARDDGVSAPHYLLSRAGGMRKFVALGRAEFKAARQRADMILGIAGGVSDETEWLRSLVAIGEVARARLQTGGEERGSEFRLDAAWAAYVARADISHEPRTLAAVAGRWKRFTRWAEARGIETLGQVGEMETRDYAAVVASHKASAARDLNTLRSVWKEMGSGTVWEGVRIPRGKRAELPEVARRYRRLETAEIVALLACALNAEERLTVLVAYYTALRLTDVLALDRADFRDGGRWLEVTPSKTRGHKGRPLSIPVASALAEALASAPEEGPLFPGLAKAGASCASKRLGKIFDRAGVADDRRGKASFHSLRATFISLMDEAGVPPHVTDSITGHAKQGMHGRYSQPGMEAKRTAVEKAIPQVV